jgi:hypothetical protein
MHLAPQIHALDNLSKKERLARVLVLDEHIQRHIQTGARNHRNKSESRSHAREIFYRIHDEDEVRCADCRGDKKLDVHHADGDAYNNDWKNLVGLCRECHQERHYGDGVADSS